VFAFDPRGLSTDGRPDDLLSVADATGGRAIVNTNEPEAHVPGVFEQNASYYLLGFRSDDTRRNGHFRKLEVRVNRPDVRVRTRSGYFAPRDRRSRRSDTPPIVRTLERGIPGDGLPIRLNVAAFGIPGRREAAVTIVATLADEGGTPGDGRLELFTAAFDSGWKERGTHRQTMTIRRESGGEQGVVQFNVLSRLALRPGRYELRFAADRDGRTGSAILNVDVPDFHASPLSLSGALLEQASMPIAGDARLLADVVPVTPTARRAFSPGDQVRVFTRAYQGREHQLRPVTLAARIINERDETVWQTRAEIGVEAFGSRRAADWLERLPLTDLTAGRYLLTIEAEAGPSRARRDVRVEVR
jgi:hypothetical protein